MRLVGQYWQKYNFPIHIHVLISQISNMFFPPVQALRARLAQIFRVRSPGWSRPQVCRPGLTADCRLHSDLLPPLLSSPHSASCLQSPGWLCHTLSVRRTENVNHYLRTSQQSVCVLAEFLCSSTINTFHYHICHQRVIIPNKMRLLCVFKS